MYEAEMFAIGHDPSARVAGQHARGIVRRLRLRTLVALGVLAIATAALGRVFGLHDIRFLVAELALLAAIFAVSRVVLPLVDRHDRGASGEEQVGGMLDDLGLQGWHVIHDASFSNGNVDHILIGAPGIFTVETKSHPGPVRVSRLHGGALSQAQAERRVIERVTGMEVEPLLVFSSAWIDRPLARRKGVRVLPARMLAGYLDRCPDRLSPSEVRRAHDQVTHALREHGARVRVPRRRRPARRSRLR